MMKLTIEEEISKEEIKRNIEDWLAAEESADVGEAFVEYATTALDATTLGDNSVSRDGDDSEDMEDLTVVN